MHQLSSEFSYSPQNRSGFPLNIGVSDAVRGTFGYREDREYRTAVGRSDRLFYYY
jgi:hypothetical protein